MYDLDQINRWQGCGIDVDEQSNEEVGPGLSLHRMVAVMVLVRNGNRNARYVFAFSRSDNEFILPNVRDSCALKGGASACERPLVGGQGGCNGRYPLVSSPGWG